MELDRRFQDGNLERIEGFLRETLSRLEEEGRGESGEYASVLNEMACFFRGVSRYTESADAFTRSLELMERLGMERTPQFATILVNCAGLYRLMKQGERSAEMFLRAKALLEQAGKQPAYAYVSVLNNLALVYQESGRLTIGTAVPAAGSDLSGTPGGR